MSWALPELTAQLITLSKKLPKGDTLSLGWFSSQGEFNWVFKGFKISDDSDYKALEKAIKANSTSIGCTCFSEILADSDTVINDLSAISKTFSLHFFTDGYPVVSNYQKEIDNIFKAIKKIKGRIHTAMLIGYGEYFNMELLSQMAEKLGAMLIHSSLIPEYSDSITKLIKLTDNSEPKEEVEPLVAAPTAIYSVTDQGVVTCSIDEDGKIYITPEKNKNTVLYYISTEKPNKKSWDKVEIPSINFGDNTDQLAKAVYAAGLILTQQTKTDVALEVLGKIGDKALIDGVSNAFTIADYGRVEEAITKGVNDVSARFSAGRDANYLPPVDAFCVFDLLNMLMEDKASAFFPYHEKFTYEKIGVGSKVLDGYSKFNPDKTSKCPFDNLTWHESRLNLSVQTKILGTIELHDINGKTPQSVGFSNPYPTFIFRNYAFIKDGRVHTKKFFITSSEATYKALKNKGVVFEDTFSSNKAYGVDVSNIPAINRKIATGKTSAKELCKLAMQEQKLKGIIKGLKWFKDEDFGEATTKATPFTDEQMQFLEANGVQATKGGSYNPPRTKEEAKDKYIAKSFELKIAGMSSLPPVKKVMEKVAAGKSRTAVEALIEESAKLYTPIKANTDSQAKLSWLETQIMAKQKELRTIRSQIQSSKFSVILGKRWFDEFQSRNENSLKVDGTEFSFVLGEEEVEI
jgi:hypothetical protein